MGNIPASDLNKVDADLDPEVLKLQATTLFNDAYVTSFADKLPNFGYSDITESSTSSDTSLTDKSNVSGEDEVDDHEERLNKLMTIFAKNLSGNSKVEDYPALSIDKALATSGFAIMNQRRARLLIRMLQVSTSKNMFFFSFF